jgi:hypothetical protein
MLPQLMASHRKDLLGNPPAAKPEPDRRGATPFEAIPPQVLADRCALYFDRTKLFRDGQLHGLERAAQVVETHAHLAGELKANHTLSKAAHAIRGEIYALNQQGA